jgi:hypothetical protein
MEKYRSITKIKLHDGIVGAIYLLSIVLAISVNLQWLYLAGGVAVLQIISPLTRFCPVYFLLDKTMEEKKSPRAGAGTV